MSRLTNEQYSELERRLKAWKKRKGIDLFDLPKPKSCKLTKEETMERMKNEQTGIKR